MLYLLRFHYIFNAHRGRPRRHFQLRSQLSIPYTWRSGWENNSRLFKFRGLAIPHFRWNLKVGGCLAGSYISVRSNFAAKRFSGSGSRALLFGLECALGSVTVVLVATFAHWAQWLLPVAVLLYLLIVVPTAPIVCPVEFGSESGQLHHAAGIRVGRAAGQPSLFERHWPCEGSRIQGQADGGPV